MGFLLRRDRAALESLCGSRARCGAGLRTCELVFHTVALACTSERVRSRIGTLLAAPLGPALLSHVGHSPYRLAQTFDTHRSTLGETDLFALLLALHTHPSDSAARIEDRVAQEIERRQESRSADAQSL